MGKLLYNLLNNYEMNGYFSRISKLFLAIASQAGWSITNLIVVIVLARELSVADFGVFAIYLTLKRGLIMVTGALIVVPLTVMCSKLSTDGRQDLTTRLLNSIAVVIIIVLIPGFVTKLLLGWHVLEIAIFVVGGVLLEVNRRISYIDAQVISDLYGSVYNFVGMLLLLFLLKKYELLNIYNSALIVGVVNISWVVATRWKALLNPNYVRFDEFREMWSIGGWGLGSSTATFIYSQVNTVYTYYLIGAAGVAVLEIGRQFVMVVKPLIYGMANYFQPKLAASAHNDPRLVFRGKLIKITFVQIIMGFVVLSGILLLSPYILNVLVPDKIDVYKGAYDVALILGIAGLLQITWQQPGFAIIALGKPKYGFITRICAALLTVPVGYYLTFSFGLAGAAFTKVVGDVIILVLVMYFYHKASIQKESQFKQVDRI